MNKVIGGTPKTCESLCVSCRAAWYMKTLNLGNIVICRAVGSGIRITETVVECATYDDKRQPSLYDMQQIAWEVRSRGRGAVGFGGASNLEVEISPPSEASKNQPMPKPICGAHLE